MINNKILRLALPMAGTQLINISGAFLCMTMLAKLGHNVLAASALIFSTQLSVMIAGASILFSLSVLVGHAYGAKNYTAIGRFIQQGWTLGLLIGIPIMIILWNIGYVLTWTGQPKIVVGIVQDFFRTHTWRVIPFFLVICNQQLCYGIRQQKIDVLASVMGVSILLITAYLLIFGKFGLPKLGVVGLAYAMAAQAWFYFLFTTTCFYFGNYFKDFQLFNYRIHQDWSSLALLFKIGWPISLQISGEVLGLAVSATLFGWLGTDTLAAYQIVMQYLFLVLIPIFALSQASGILVGQACGSQQFDEIKKLGRSSISLAIGIGLIIGTIFILFPKFLASIYLDINNPINNKIVHLVVLLFVVIAISQFFDALRNILTGILRGLFDTRFPMLVGLLTLWFIGIPLSYTFGFIFHWDAVGIAMGSVVGMIIGVLVLMFRYFIRLPISLPK